MEEAPLVSICCLTYNHAAFVAESLDGFLRQETNFGVEILIHDDASTDGTDAIIREYAEKYPDRIFPLYEEVNQCTNGYSGMMDIVFNYSRARGKYIAYCEGDDYWTDPLKLQKQVDFMESHPDYSVCFHRCMHLNSDNGKETRDGCGWLFRDGKEGVDITMDLFFGSWVTQPLTMVFRRSVFSPEWQQRYEHYRDMHEIYHLLKVGKGYLFGFIGGVYRYHSGGIHSMLSTAEYCAKSLPIDEEFYLKNPSVQSRNNYLNTLQECVSLYASVDKKKALGYLFKHFRVSQNPKAFYKMLGLILKSKNGKK